MNDAEKYLDPEEMVSCPYEVSHVCPRKRLAIHIAKCRKQHLEMSNDLRTCIHNIQHKIARPEYQYHLETCPDRENYYQSRYQIGTEECDALPALMENMKIELNIPSNENWDNDASTNVLENIQQTIHTKNVLQNFSNEPPAIRKAMREETRRKTREKLNVEVDEQERNTKRSVRGRGISLFARNNVEQKINEREDDDCASVVSAASAASVASSAESDVSFKTALTSTTEQRMPMFAKPESTAPLERGRGRGRGWLRAPATTSLQMSPVRLGIGRSKQLRNA